MPPKHKPKLEKVVRGESREDNNNTKLNLLPVSQLTGSEELIQSPEKQHHQ